MNNKGFNPLFVSALDILTGALGVFIVLNFLRTNNPPPTPIQPPALAQNGTPADKATTNAREGKGDYRYTRPPAPKPQPANPTPSNPNPQTGSTQTPAQNTPATTPPPVSNPNPVTPQPQSAPQDPVAVDLMRSTQGVVVLLLQQFGQAKNSVEFMIRQGNKTWKPTRASKYQDNVFAYNRALNYFYQTELHPGTYEVLAMLMHHGITLYLASGTDEAYVLAEATGKRQAILIATGSEVEIALAAKAQLEAEGIGTRVVSMPCMELFAEQDEAGRGVQVLGVIEDQSSLMPRYEPDHPMANADGYVYYPNVNVVEEMADMISASRAFQTNVEMMNTAKQMLQRVLTLGQ